MVDFRNLGSSTEGFRWCDDVRVMDDMNNLRSYELRPLDTMNNSRLWMIWTILHHTLKQLDAMNNLGLWMTWMTLGHKLRALNAMNNSRVWMRWATPSHELITLDAMKSLGLLITWAQDSRCYEQSRVVNYMNDLGSYKKSPLQAMNCSDLFTWITLSHDLRAPEAMSNSELWMNWISCDLVCLGL